MHGRGAGDDGPIITAHARSPKELGVALRENMVFICKPSAITADNQYICTWGDTVVITKNGGPTIREAAARPGGGGGLRTFKKFKSFQSF